MPRLRLRYTALTTALIAGLLHGTWHFLIAFWAGGSFSGGQWTTYLLGILFFYLGALPAYRVLMVWVYDRTASLLVAMLMHASLSASALILQPPLTGADLSTWNLTLTAILWVVVAAVALGNGGRLFYRDNRSGDVRREPRSGSSDMKHQGKTPPFRGGQYDMVEEHIMPHNACT